MNKLFEPYGYSRTLSCSGNDFITSNWFFTTKGTDKKVTNCSDACLFTYEDTSQLKSTERWDPFGLCLFARLIQGGEIEV